MDFHGIKSSFVSESSGSADLLPLPFAEPRSARFARRAGLRSASRGAIRHRKLAPPNVAKRSLAGRRHVRGLIPCQLKERMEAVLRVLIPLLYVI